MPKDSSILTIPTPEKNRNGYPVVTPAVAQALLGHFAGGDTPGIRTALLALERAAEEAQGTR